MITIYTNKKSFLQNANHAHESFTVHDVIVSNKSFIPYFIGLFHGLVELS
jgi:hypothetical protein